MAVNGELIIRYLGAQDYEPTWRRMQHFTDTRNSDTVDEIWLLEHEPVFTQGQAGKAEHLLSTGDIPVVQVDRGGQVTYHGPGQLVVYLMIDLRRSKIGVREIVTLMEKSIISVLAKFSIDGYTKSDAPGVYVNQTKIASLGLRVRRGCSFHGFALNLDLDTTPFLRINPCGYAGMKMSNLSDFVNNLDKQQVAQLLADFFVREVGYNVVTIATQFE